MLAKHRSRFLAVGLLLAALFALAGPATAAPAHNAVASAQAAPCDDGDRYTPSGRGHVLFCTEEFTANGIKIVKVTGIVHTAGTFGQVRWVTSTGQAVWQTTDSPFGAYFTNPLSLTFRACIVNSECGVFR